MLLMDFLKWVLTMVDANEGDEAWKGEKKWEKKERDVECKLSWGLAWRWGGFSNKVINCLCCVGEMEMVSQGHGDGGSCGRRTRDLGVTW